MKSSLKDSSSKQATPPTKPRTWATFPDIHADITPLKSRAATFEGNRNIGRTTPPNQIPLPEQNQQEIREVYSLSIFILPCLIDLQLQQGTTGLLYRIKTFEAVHNIRSTEIFARAPGAFRLKTGRVELILHWL